MLKKIFFGAAVMCIAIVGIARAEEAVTTESSTEAKAALAAAQAWLTMADQGQYDQTWQSAAEYFKALVPQAQWQAQLSAVRKPLGDLVSRNVKGQEYKTSLPGVADGQYYIVALDTSFANKKVAVETVTVMKEKDGQWRLAGYFIK